MWRVAVESILGLNIRGGRELVLNPCIAADWRRCRLRYRAPVGGDSYEIIVENPDRRETGVRQATLDGQPATVVDGAAVIPITSDGRSHRVSLRL
jgi:cyclic beta-1,2-glucan synthetase